MRQLFLAKGFSTMRMLHITLITALTVILLTVSSTATDPREMTAPALKFDPPSVEQFTLKNGIRVVFLPAPQLPVVRMSLMFPGGTAHDPSELCGVSEITAAVMRSGGAGKMSADQIDEELDFLAASISSNATNDKQELEMSCLKSDFSNVLSLFSQILTQPSFDTARLALEIANKKDEIQRQFDSPTGATRILFYETVYGGMLYGKYPTLKSVGAIDLDNVRYTYNKLYTPSQGILAVSGAMTRAEVEKALNTAIGGWAGTKVMERRAPETFDASKLPAPGVYYAYKDISQSSMRLGHLTDLFTNPDRHAVRIMNYAIGVGFTGRLTAKVRSEAGLAYSVGGYFIEQPTQSVYFAYCQSRADATVEATQMIVDIIKDVKANGITEEEFERSKESILNSFVFEYETPQQVVESVANNLFYGFPADQTEQDLAALKAVTYADCNRVAKQYYEPDTFVYVVVGDTAKMDAPLSTFGTVHALPLEVK